MFEHAFPDLIGAVRTNLELALLERTAIEERFVTDAATGDVRWDTTYSLPGEGPEGRVQADVTLVWGAWAQSAYRRWLLTGELSDVPVVDAEVVVRAGDLDLPPDAVAVNDAMPRASAPLGAVVLERLDGPTVETTWSLDGESATHGIELGYAATIPLTLELLEDGNRIDETVADLGAWLTSALITLSDMGSSLSN